MSDPSQKRPLFAAAGAIPAAGVASPCVSVCTMNAATGLCDGCLRTIDEIAHWTLFDDDEKRAVLAQLARRRSGAAQPRALP